MKQLFSLIGILLVTCLSCAGESHEPGEQPNEPTPWDGPTITAMAYNIHHCNPPSKPELIDVEAIAAVILAEEPDFVALQEVDVNTLRSGKQLNQAKALATLTDMHYHFVKAIDYQEGEYGVAVLSKHPIEHAFGFSLPMADGLSGEPRVVAAVDVLLPTGETITFASTHLDLRPEHRRLQPEKIVAELGHRANPVIIGGDFNAVPGTEPIDIMGQTFRNTCVGSDCPGTIPVNNPNRVIDYIFYRPFNELKVIEHRVVPETYASDHLPVVTRLQLK